MSAIEVTIIQGTASQYPRADVNIVIDVIRAFTVSHIAFLRGANEILLVNTVAEAMAIRNQNPAYKLAGEVAGLPIAGFDLDNSPHTFSLADLDGKTLVQKTTNGVKATLLALDARVTLVTGLSNAKKTADHVRKLALADGALADAGPFKINVIASHPTYDDDLACADYIKDQILGLNSVSLAQVQRRIDTSHPAQKFFDPGQPEFKAQDLPFCTREVPCDFVMQVEKSQPLPRIVKKVVG